MIHRLVPTFGDAVAIAAWVLLIALWVAVRLSEVNETVERILDELFGSGR